MKLYDVRIGSMHYGLCLAHNEQEVVDHYEKTIRTSITAEEVVRDDLPVLEISITQEVKDYFK